MNSEAPIPARREHAHAYINHALGQHQARFNTEAILDDLSVMTAANFNLANIDEHVIMSIISAHEINESEQP